MNNKYINLERTFNNLLRGVSLNGSIRCPFCAVKTDLRYLEDITCYRSVGIMTDGILRVDGRYETGEGYDEGIPGTGRLECSTCRGQFLLPNGIEIRWE